MCIHLAGYIAPVGAPAGLLVTILVDYCVWLVCISEPQNENGSNMIV